MKTFSRCIFCQKGLGNIRLSSPLYCVECIEKMDRLGMSPKQYGKHIGSE